MPDLREVDNEGYEDCITPKCSLYKPVACVDYSNTYTQNSSMELQSGRESC
jgi:hypothetical protein